MRVTRLRLSNGTRIVGIKLPYKRLRNWRAILERGGVTMDDEAKDVIQIIEKDATEAEKRNTGGDGDKRAKAEQAGGSAAVDEDEGGGGAGGGAGGAAGGAAARKRKAAAQAGRRGVNMDFW